MRPETLYIDGEWRVGRGGMLHEAQDPRTEDIYARFPLADGKELDAAVAAARTAFASYAATSISTRLSYLYAVLEAYDAHLDGLAEAIHQEMGAPLWFARDAHCVSGRALLTGTISALERYEEKQVHGSTQIYHQPVGVCGLITPWNWPINQMMAKVAPALAAGCTMVLKPSEYAPLSAIWFAERLDEAGLPKGVFNMVLGEGPVIGRQLAGHPGIDMISFTGSTRAGADVAWAAAPSIKRVHQELGGKSASILLAGVDVADTVGDMVRRGFANAGQSCNAGTRLLVPQAAYDEACTAAAAVVAATPFAVSAKAGKRTMGPLANAQQFKRVQDYIQIGIDQGARVLAGGVGRPSGIEQGFFVRPTIFADVTPDMTIAREEIFGPVLVIMPYADEADAIRIANDSPYGLSGYVYGGDSAQCLRVARRLRTGNVHINGAPQDYGAPFGGFKQSGNGRERGSWGLHDFMEVQAIMSG